MGLLITAGSILLFGLAGFIAFAAMCAFAYHTIQNLNVEYEYLLVDKIFSVDRILNKMRRKKAAEYTLEAVSYTHLPMLPCSILKICRDVTVIIDKELEAAMR